MPYALLGLSFGLSAGISPGPLLALVIQRSLQGGLASGLRIALAPLITDLPIVILAMLVVSRLPESALDWLLFIGGLFVLWLGIDALRHAGHSLETAIVTTPSQDIMHGALINFLNPHPYLFWGLVGAPTVIQAWQTQPLYAVAFVVLFYVMLIGSKVMLAFLVSRAHGLPSHRHQTLLRITSLIMIVAGLSMLYAAWPNVRSLL
ncbi:MAG: LysE family transporter [Caldilineales bacterium]|nr:LysE family transporter [Caldilineales bacterium]